MKKYFVVLILITLFWCQKSEEKMNKPYVVEVTTFKYKSTVKSEDFWKEDAQVEAIYTSKQPGFINRESGYSEDKEEVVVVVYWETNEDAEASMKKFMSSASVVTYANMIDGSTMNMARYTVK